MASCEFGCLRGAASGLEVSGQLGEVLASVELDDHLDLLPTEAFLLGLVGKRLDPSDRGQADPIERLCNAGAQPDRLPECVQLDVFELLQEDLRNEHPKAVASPRRDLEDVGIGVEFLPRGGLGGLGGVGWDGGHDGGSWFGHCELNLARVSCGEVVG